MFVRVLIFTLTLMCLIVYVHTGINIDISIHDYIHTWIDVDI